MSSSQDLSSSGPSCAFLPKEPDGYHGAMAPTATLLVDGRRSTDTGSSLTRELTMDILRHGHHLEVLQPAELRQAVQLELKLAMAQYLMPS